MKVIIIIFLTFLIIVSLSANELTFNEKMEIANSDWKNLKLEFYISPGVIADVGIGTIQRIKLEKYFQEATIIIHADLYPHVWEENIDEFYKIYFWGAKFRSAYFYKADYSGFNWFVNVGFQSFYFGIYNSRWIVFPDVAIGCGYSWKLKNNHHFRISLDAGIKILLTNLYLSYVW